MLIGLGHAAQVGKDSLGAVLVRDHGFSRVSFADTLRAIAYRSHPRVRSVVDQYGWESAKTTYPDVRKFLVDLGNAGRRYIAEDVWVQAAARRIEPDQDTVLTDVRFKNEVDWIKANGGHVVRIDRPGYCPLRNEADLALADYDGWDYVLLNDGSLDDLTQRAAVLVTQLHPNYSPAREVTC